MEGLDLKALIDAGGLALAAAVALVVVVAFIRDMLHSDGELKRERENTKLERDRADAERKAREKDGERIDNLTAALREGNALDRELAQSVAFIVRDLERWQRGEPAGPILAPTPRRRASRSAPRSRSQRCTGGGQGDAGQSGAGGG